MFVEMVTRFCRLCLRKVILNQNKLCLMSMSTATTPKLFNDEGRVLEYDKSLDYFTLFGIDKSFNIEIADVAKTYKNLQKQLHPDKVRLMCEYFVFKTFNFIFSL